MISVSSDSPSRPERRPLGRTGLEVSRLGFGAAPIADLYSKRDESEAVETAITAVDLGINLIDTSPFYGQGLSEQRVGAALRHRPGNDVVISTKAGRFADPFRPPVDSTFAGGLPHSMQLDYSYEGTMRSIEQSLLRLGTDRVDIVLVHDLDVWTHGDRLEQHYRTAMDGAVRALTELRDAGTISGYGVGVNEAALAERFVRDTDADVVLLAGRYTLLDQSAADSFLPLAAERNVGVILGGVFNSGILATGAVEGARYDYQLASPELLDRVSLMERVCHRHDAPLHRTALQFALAHPAVTCVVLGATTPAEVKTQVEDISASISPELWADLKSEGLLADTLPT